MSILTPDYQDEVQHITNEAAGTVIAIYVIDDVTYLDVTTDSRVYYKTPAANWKVTEKYEE
jgi:hypothetical protein